MMVGVEALVTNEGTSGRGVPVTWTARECPRQGKRPQDRSQARANPTLGTACMLGIKVTGAATCQRGQRKGPNQRGILRESRFQFLGLYTRECSSNGERGSRD